MTNSLEDLCTDLVKPASFPISIIRFTSVCDYNHNLTLALEIVDVVLSDDHAALLMPIILVYLHHFAGHHNDLSSSYKMVIQDSYAAGSSS